MQPATHLGPDRVRPEEESHRRYSRYSRRRRPHKLSPPFAATYAFGWEANLDRGPPVSH